MKKTENKNLWTPWKMEGWYHSHGEISHLDPRARNLLAAGSGRSSSSSQDMTELKVEFFVIRGISSNMEWKVTPDLCRLKVMQSTSWIINKLSWHSLYLLRQNESVRGTPVGLKLKLGTRLVYRWEIHQLLIHHLQLGHRHLEILECLRRVICVYALYIYVTGWPVVTDAKEHVTADQWDFCICFVTLCFVFCPCLVFRSRRARGYHCFCCLRYFHELLNIEF